MARSLPVLASPTTSTAEPATSFPIPPAPPAPPPGQLTEEAGWNLSKGILGAALAIALLLVAIGIALAVRARTPSEEPAPARGVATGSEAATIAPAEATDGTYQFLSIPWGTSRADVRSRLESRGFAFIETDELGTLSVSLDDVSVIATPPAPTTWLVYIGVDPTPDDNEFIGSTTNTTRTCLIFGGPSA